MYSNVSLRPIIRPCFLFRYLNACNSIDSHNIMWKYDLALDKYWVTQGGYFRLVTTVALGVGITYGKLIFCHGISQESDYKTISTKYYNNRKVYYCFNNIFTADFGSPDLNLPPITIDDRPCPHTIALYTSDIPPSDIYVASEIMLVL